MVTRYLRQNLPVGDPFPVAGQPCRNKMDQNESPVELPGEVKDKLIERLMAWDWSRYPQPRIYHEIKEKLSSAIGVRAEQFAITSGCDGAIQGIHFLAGGAGRTALDFLPTYPMLHHAAFMAGTRMDQVLIGPEYKIDPGTARGHDLVLVANPNNPTGTLTPESLIRTLLSTQSMIFVDEAYYDFSGITMIHLLDSSPNLAIGRSFSKSMLAGVRLGLLIGHPEMVRCYESVITAPYHLSHWQLTVAENYDLIQPHINNMAHAIVQERKRLDRSLSELGIQAYPSEANFILMKVPAASQTYNRLIECGIRLRNMCHLPGLESHLRVTVGTREQNEGFLEALRSVIHAAHP